VLLEAFIKGSAVTKTEKQISIKKKVYVCQSLLYLLPVV